MLSHLVLNALPKCWTELGWLTTLPTLQQGCPKDTTALHKASSNGHTEVVEVLLVNGARPEDQNEVRLESNTMLAC
jgi:hypothetical protein